jgi:hypothetical protein
VLECDGPVGAGMRWAGYRAAITSLSSDPATLSPSSSICRVHILHLLSQSTPFGQALTLQIDPKIVREAYSLLRQSIIHVEQDDINFDEEDAAAAALNSTNGHTTQDEESQDAADIAAMEAAESSYNAATSSAAQTNGNGATDDSLPKRKMRITCTFSHLLKEIG